MAHLLAPCVLDGDRIPLFTSEEWEAFGGKHLSDFMKLWDVAWRLADFNGEQAAKNSTAPASDSQ
jgi:hypothetical protein